MFLMPRYFSSQSPWLESLSCNLWIHLHLASITYIVHLHDLGAFNMNVWTKIWFGFHSVWLNFELTSSTWLVFRVLKFFFALVKPEATTSASVSVTGIENCLWIGNQWSSLSMQKCLVLAVDYIWVPVNFSEVHLIQLSIALRCVWNSAGEELITGQTGNIRLGWRLQSGPATLSCSGLWYL